MLQRKANSKAGFWHDNSLGIVFLLLTLLTLAGHAFAGWRLDIAQDAEHHLAPHSLAQYLVSGEFLSSVFENWESEFLQMGMFVLLTVWLKQRGSSESRQCDPDDEKKPAPPPRAEQPWPARRGGWVLKVYEHSLSGALLLMFVTSFVLHWYNSWRQHVQDQLHHAQVPTTLAAYFFDAQLWFESLQNWQSEFLSVVVLVVLSIYLREKDSPQSKAVTARHSDTGTD